MEQAVAVSGRTEAFLGDPSSSSPIRCTCVCSLLEIAVRTNPITVDFLLEGSPTSWTPCVSSWHCPFITHYLCLCLSENGPCLGFRKPNQPYQWLSYKEVSLRCHSLCILFPCPAQEGALGCLHVKPGGYSCTV